MIGRDPEWERVAVLYLRRWGWLIVEPERAILVRLVVGLLIVAISAAFADGVEGLLDAWSCR